MSTIALVVLLLATPAPGAPTATEAVAFQRYLAIAKDLANIAFFILVGGVTILTYRKARRTILQPIRTEVFKRQVDIFSEILGTLVGKQEHELRREFGFEDVIRANSFMVVDAYTRRTFDYHPDINTRPYSKAECPAFRFRIAPGVAEVITNSYGDISVEGKEQDWSKFQLMLIKLPNKYIAAEKAFRRFLESPLVPLGLGKVLQEFADAVHGNIDQVGLALEQYARELPARYPTLESVALQEISSPVANIFNRSARQLKPIADKIIAYIRSYFEIEHLLET
jgi:hypothetical protein